MEIREYRKAASLEEAYELLGKSRQNRIIAGCTFLHRTRLKINIAIDLSDCGLSYIRETEQEMLIGAYTCLRDMETSELLCREFGDVFTEVLKHLIGIQLRSHITIGAHVYSRYGFSDLIPVLLSLGARVRLYRCGEMSLKDFMNAEPITIKGDILTEIVLPKEGRKAKGQMMRNSYNDYSIFCLAVSRADDDWIIAAGAHPGRAALAERTMERLKGAELTTDAISAFVQEIPREFRFGSTFRASAEYQSELCSIFARRALEELRQRTGDAGEG